MKVEGAGGEQTEAGTEELEEYADLLSSFAGDDREGGRAVGTGAQQLEEGPLARLAFEQAADVVGGSGAQADAARRNQPAASLSI